MVFNWIKWDKNYKAFSSSSGGVFLGIFFFPEWWQSTLFQFFVFVCLLVCSGMAWHARTAHKSLQLKSLTERSLLNPCPTPQPHLRERSQELRAPTPQPSTPDIQIGQETELTTKKRERERERERHKGDCWKGV